METRRNFIMISPHFPANFESFAPRLKAVGFNTLGIADIPYEQLSPRLKDSLTEYYRVDNMEDYEQVYRAVAFFAHKYGRIDRIESHNEHWLELDARLRTDFNVFGYKTSDLDPVKKKSSMKEVFINLGLPVAKGSVFSDEKDALKLIDELGYPVIIKPDSGVGAVDTYKINNEDELKNFFMHKNPAFEYIMEEFIPGDMVTFDGMTDKEGNIVFSSSLNYNAAVLETVGKDDDMYFFLPRKISDDLVEMGSRIVKGFGVKERFFHFEFFRSEGRLIPLEVNMRPPGGPTIDMFNYANDLDVFKEYANIVKENKFYAKIERPYYCAYVSRKYNHYKYRYNRQAISEKLGDALISVQSIPGIFSAILGDEGYLFKCKEEDVLFDTIRFISEKETEA